MSLEIQRMIRDQANETRDELTKMVSWETEIQARDDQLIALARDGKFGYAPPELTRAPGQTTAAKPKKVTIQAEPAAPTASSPAPRSYNEWDKLDAKLKSMDMEADEEDPRESAEDHKNKGNEFFKKKNYALALREYSTAQRLDPSNAVYCYNRSIAYFHLSNFAECEKDATKALSLDARYTKAFVRRGLAREAQAKFELALQDFEAADALEPGVPLVLDKLKGIREKLGISADGRIRQVQEPKVAIIEETETETEPGRAEPPVEKEEVEGRKRPKIEVVSEVSFAPQQQAKPKPKIEVVEEAAPQPGRVRIVAEEPAAPKKVTIVDETKSEEPPRPKKVTIVDQTKPAPKVEVVQEPPKPTKVTIVDETKPAPKIEVVEEPPKPAKVTIVDDSKAEVAAVPAESPIPKPKGPRPQNITVTVEDIDSPRTEPAKKGSAEPAKKGPAAKGKATQPFYSLINWVDLPSDQYSATVARLKPKELNKSLGADWSGDVVVKLLVALERMDNHVLAFEFLEELTANKMLAMHLTREHRTLATPLVIQVMDAADVDGGRKAAIRTGWRLD
jgi:tetratricopeptide (TPR) repeat protein